MNRKKTFSFLLGDMLAMCVGGEPPQKFPLTYTLEEALEDWCDRAGVCFIKILETIPDRNITSLGSGRFSFSDSIRRGSFNVRITKQRLYSDFYNGSVGDEWSW